MHDRENKMGKKIDYIMGITVAATAIDVFVVPTVTGMINHDLGQTLHELLGYSATGESATFTNGIIRAHEIAAAGLAFLYMGTRDRG